MDKGLIKLCAILPAAPDESLAYKAKKQRFDFISGAGVHDLGIDLAESVQAGNSAKHLLTHQLAVPHKMAMQFMANARQELSAYINSGHKFPHRRIEAARMAATSARLIDIFQRGLLTLDRLRNGGRQKGTVQHVNCERQRTSGGCPAPFKTEASANDGGEPMTIKGPDEPGG